ncbi:MAG: hypothetical protein ACKO3G_01260 [Planctomycetaceae bacterium]
MLIASTTRCPWRKTTFPSRYSSSGASAGWAALPSSSGWVPLRVQRTTRSAAMSSGPAGSTPSTTRFTPDVITPTHSPPAGLGNQRTDSGVLERGKARIRRVGAATATPGGAGGANSLNCAGRASASSAAYCTCSTPVPAATGASAGSAPRARATSADTSAGAS